MKVQKGYFYFIKDYYYDKVQDKELMQNKENGSKRPCFYCFKDSSIDDLFWFIPISSKVLKYKEIYDKKVTKQIKNKKVIHVDTFVFGKINNEDRVFLIQNMFPLIERFVNDTYIRNNAPVRISYELQKEIEMKATKVFSLVKRGNKGLVFPDIINIRRIMIEELKKEKKIIEYMNNKNIFIEEIKEIISNLGSIGEVKDFIEIVRETDQNLGNELVTICDKINSVVELLCEVKYYEKLSLERLYFFDFKL